MPRAKKTAAKKRTAKKRVRSFLMLASFRQLTAQHVQVSFDPPLYVRAMPFVESYATVFNDWKRVNKMSRPSGPSGNNMMNCIPATARDWKKG